MNVLQMVPQDNSSFSTVLITFLVRIINELHSNQSHPATVALVNFNSPDLDYVPVQLMKRVPGVAFLSIDVTKPYAMPTPTYIPIVVHHFTASYLSHSPHAEVFEMLQTFELFGKEKKVIVIVDSAGMKSRNLTTLATTYEQFGVIDIIYVTEKDKSISINGFDGSSKQLVPLRYPATVRALYPDRLSNLSGKSYHVLCYKNIAKCYRNENNRTVGSDVDAYNIIAKHQSTAVEYIYAEGTVELFEPYSTSVDLATYRIVPEKQPTEYQLLRLPDMIRWCIAVPKSYKRIIHEQVIWPFAVDLWILLFGMALFFVIYRTMIQTRLLRHYPSIYTLVNAPLDILKITLLFLFSEYYTAMLTSILGLSQLPAYPKTLREFLGTEMLVLFPSPALFNEVDEGHEPFRRIVTIKSTKAYDPSKLAILQVCDVFRYTISSTTHYFGKRQTHHRFHLIEEPIRVSLTFSLFRKTSPHLHRFRRYVSWLNEAGIWEHLEQKWNKIASNAPIFDRQDDPYSAILGLDHFLPVFIVGGYCYLATIIIFVMELIVGRVHKAF
uniref:Ionotropic glutamate receptor L-glutamate and glycine-binding domain-containing protein n=1 Tax=Anopheles farauti TaxID=69004 RepID=A0A182QVQ1_9DIPT